MSVRWSVGHTFEFLSKVCTNTTCTRHSRLRVHTSHYTECSNLVADMVNVLEVNKVADMVADMAGGRRGGRHGGR